MPGDTATVTLPVRLSVGRHTIELGQVEVPPRERDADGLDAVSEATIAQVADLLMQAGDTIRTPVPPLATADRDTATQELARWLVANPRLTAEAAAVAGIAEAMAEEMIRRLPDGPQLTIGLQKLIEAKDCFVRAAL